MMNRRCLSIAMLGAALAGAGCTKSSSPEVAEVAAAERAAPTSVAVAEPSPKAKVTEAPVLPRTDPAIPDGGSFAFPKDTGGKLLARFLAPAAPMARPKAAPAAPRERRIPAYLDTPALPFASAAEAPPLLPIAKLRDVRPSPLPDRVPFDLAAAVPALPDRPAFHSGSLTRQASRDPNLPADLPILSPRPVPDRAPLDDPTTEFTAQSAISASLPLRTEPAAFIRFNLPDPFEHSEAARPRTPVVENPNRAIAAPPPPRKN